MGQVKEKVKPLPPQEYESIFFLELENLKLRAINAVLRCEKTKVDLALALKKVESDFENEKRKLDIEYTAIIRKIMVDTNIPEAEWHQWVINDEKQRVVRMKEE